MAIITTVASRTKKSQQFQNKQLVSIANTTPLSLYQVGEEGKRKRSDQDEKEVKKKNHD